MLEDERQKYRKCQQIGEEKFAIFVRMGYQQTAPLRPYIDMRVGVN